MDEIISRMGSSSSTISIRSGCCVAMGIRLPGSNAEGTANLTQLSLKTQCPGKPSPSGAIGPLEYPENRARRKTGSASLGVYFQIPRRQTHKPENAGATRPQTKTKSKP